MAYTIKVSKQLRNAASNYAYENSADEFNERSCEYWMDVFTGLVYSELVDQRPKNMLKDDFQQVLLDDCDWDELAQDICSKSVVKVVI
jgi:hypothetical protein